MKIQLNLSDKEFELFLNTIKFHEDRLKQILTWINNESKYIEEGWYDKWYDKSMKIKTIDRCQELLNEVKNCNNFFNKVRSNNNIDEFDITDEEYNEMLKFVVEQIYHAKNRTNDFKIDRFGWGIDACNKLIEQETEYINVLNKVFNKYCGDNTYESILDKLC